MFSTLCLLLLPAFQAKQPVDLVITGAYVVTVNAAMDTFPQGAVAVHEGAVVAVGPAADVTAAYTGRETVSAGGMLLLPGLVNGHTHAAMTLLRGISDDVPLESWLNDYIWPAEKQVMTRDAVRAGTQLALVELIKSGCTTINDGYFYADTVAETAAAAGFRAQVAEPVADFAMPGSADEPTYYKVVEAMIARWKDHPLITVALGPHATYTCSPDLLQRLGAFGAKHHLPMHLHLSETPTEVATIKAKYGRTPVRHVQALGLLNDQLIAAHGVVLDAEEIALFAASGAGIIHNPRSNMKLGSGIAPIAELLKAGVPVGLGTDGAASNNTMDMLRELSAAALLQKVRKGDPSAIKAADVVAMATRGSARVLGLEDRIGSLEVGKRADLILVSLEAPHMAPFYDPYSTLVYVAGGADVDSVMVDGKWLMRKRVLLTLDERAVVAEARTYGKRIQKLLAERKAD